MGVFNVLVNGWDGIDAQVGSLLGWPPLTPGDLVAMNLAG